MCLPAALPCPIDGIFLFVGCVFALSVESAFLRIWEPAFLPPDSHKNVFSGLDNVGFEVFSPWKFRFWVPSWNFIFRYRGKKALSWYKGKTTFPKIAVSMQGGASGFWIIDPPQKKKGIGGLSPRDGVFFVTFSACCCVFNPKKKKASKPFFFSLGLCI